MRRARAARQDDHRQPDLADVTGAEVTVTIDGSGQVDVRGLAAQDTAVVVDGSGAVP